MIDIIREIMYQLQLDAHGFKEAGSKGPQV